MRGWGLVFGLLAVVTLLALALRALPPAVLVPGMAAGGGYAAYRLIPRKKALKENVEGRVLGLERVEGDPFGLAMLPLRLLGRGSGRATVDHVMRGTWRTLEVQLFDFRYVSEDDAGDDRRFTCSLMPLERDVPPLVIEPKTFFTPLAERAALDAIEVGDRAFAEAFEVRTADPRFAADLLGEETRGWMKRLEGNIAFEVNGRMLLAYMPRDRRDMLALLEASAELGRHLPA